MKVVVVIPTYNEKENVENMAKAVLGQEAFESNNQTNQTIKQSNTSLSLLFVDDNSPDGTGEIIEGLMKSEPRLHCLHRTKKEGLGRAYVAGFKKALELGADIVIQMDCDFSHDPKDIPRLVEAITTPVPGTKHQAPGTPDLIIGSRYVKGGGTPGWPFKRRLISRCGGIFIRTVTGMPIKDPTGGFRCWRRATLEGLDLDTVESAGYSFQLEMNHRTWKRGFKIREIPIVFTDRVAGYSKITAGIALESIKISLRLRFKKK